MHRRAETRVHRGARREPCDACKLPAPACDCALFPRARPETRIVVVRHAREKGMFGGTGGLVGLVLAGSELVPFGDPAAPLDLRALVDPAVDFHVLFPSRGARVVGPDLRESARGRRLGLVIPDGSWSQARKMTHRLVTRLGLPLVRLPEGSRPRFALRIAPGPGQLGTAEAVALALENVGDPAAAAALREALETVAGRVLGARGRRSSRTLRARREPTQWRPPCPPPPRTVHRGQMESEGG